MHEIPAVVPISVLQQQIYSIWSLFVQSSLVNMNVGEIFFKIVEEFFVPALYPLIFYL